MKGLHLFFTYFNIKTLTFNFYYLPFKQAIRLPFLLSRNTRLKCMRGVVSINAAIKTGMIRIGCNEVGLFDKKYCRPIWENSGTVVFNGSAIFKYGAKIIVGRHGKLTIGDGLRFSSGSSVVCYKQIDIGNECRISWDSQIMDTDFHKIFNVDSMQINPDKEIRLGNNCWIGNHSLVCKGTKLGNMVVLASNSMVNKEIPDNNVILAGSPARIVKTSIYWTYE